MANKKKLTLQKYLEEKEFLPIIGKENGYMEHHTLSLDRRKGFYINIDFPSQIPSSLVPNLSVMDFDRIAKVMITIINTESGPDHDILLTYELARAVAKSYEIDVIEGRRNREYFLNYQSFVANKRNADCLVGAVRKYESLAGSQPVKDLAARTELTIVKGIATLLD